MDQELAEDVFNSLIRRAADNLTDHLAVEAVKHITPEQLSVLSGTIIERSIKDLSIRHSHAIESAISMLIEKIAKNTVEARREEITAMVLAKINDRFANAVAKTAEDVISRVFQSVMGEIQTRIGTLARG